MLKSQLPHQGEVVAKINALGMRCPVGFAHQHRMEAVLIPEITHEGGGIRRNRVVRISCHAQLPRR